MSPILVPRHSHISLIFRKNLYRIVLLGRNMWHIFQATADRIQRRISRMDRSLETSFINVKRDTSNLGEWVRYLNEKSQRQEERAEEMASEIKALNEELSAIPKTPEDIRRIIDQYYSYESLLMRIKIIEQRVEEMVLKS